MQRQWPVGMDEGRVEGALQRALRPGGPEGAAESRDLQGALRPRGETDGGREDLQGALRDHVGRRTGEGRICRGR